MDEKTKNINQDMIPYIAHESEMARLERIIKRFFVLCILLVIVAVGSNIGWLIYESQFEDVTTTVTQELRSGFGGDATINDGVHINGADKADSNNEN